MTNHPLHTLLALLLLPAATMPSQAANQPAATTASALSAWPQTQSDIPADPAVRFGQLANGMRYAIMHNTTPAGQVALRLHMASGSLQESDAQQGLAHFLEHMAFRGSRHVPDGEVQKTLERLGLQFGADTNAYTAEGETVYQFDLAKDDAVSLDTGLMLMRETADRLTLDPKTFDAERGVVISEQRLRDVPLRRMYDGVGEFQFEGQRVTQRHPIGKLEVLQHAPVAELQDYYRKWYRPERATLIVVGDIDVDAIEARIRKGFGDWAAATPAPPEPDLGSPMQRGASARHFVSSDAAPMIDIGWVRPAETTVANQVREQRDVLRTVALGALNRRLRAAAAVSKPPFVQASAGVNAAGTYAEVTDFGLGYQPGEWREALLAAEQLRRQAVAQGLTQEEVDREAASLLTAVQAEASGAATRPSTQLAVALVATLAHKDVFTSPQRDLETVAVILKGLKVDAVNTALRELFSGSGPLAFIGSPTDIANADSSVQAALHAAESAPLAVASAGTAQAWPYGSFGSDGKLVARQLQADLDLTTARFANGVRLNIKPTKFAADQILINVSVGSGRLDLPGNRPNLITAANAGAFVAGGLGKLSYTSLQSTLAGKVYRAAFNVGDDSYNLNGQTRPADLDLQLQVLAAYLTDPGFRDEGLQQVKTALATQLQQVNGTPLSLFSTGVGRLLRSGDLRWGLPTNQELQAASSADLKSWLAPALASGPLEITIVGDVTVDAAIAAVGRSFGALPTRQAGFRHAAAGALPVAAANAVPATLVHTGNAEQGIAAVAWPTTDTFANLGQVPVRQLLAAVLQDRLTEDLREHAGAVYTVQMQGQSSTVFPGFGVMLGFADIPPARAQLFYDAVTRRSAELRNAPVSNDELERARNPAISTLRQAQQNNQYYLGMLSAAQREPRSLELIRQLPARLQAVTAADLQQCAARYLRDDRMWRLLVKSAAGP